MRTIVLAAAMLGLAAAGAADAALTITVRQSGANVVADGRGSLDVSTLQPNIESSIVGNVYPEFAGLTIAPVGFPPTFFDDYRGIVGPADFGAGSLKLADAHTGDGFGLIGSVGALFVQQGYVSGAMLAGTSTYVDETFATLGLRPGTYVYSWSGRAGLETLTVDIVADVPEPATWATMILGLGAIGATMRRRRRGARLALA